MSSHPFLTALRPSVRGTMMRQFLLPVTHSCSFRTASTVMYLSDSRSVLRVMRSVPML